MWGVGQRLCNGVYITGLSTRRYQAIFNTYAAGGRVQDLFPEATWKTSFNRSNKTVTGRGMGLVTPVTRRQGYCPAEDVCRWVRVTWPARAISADPRHAT